jgi:hypothetical protein
VSRPRFRGVEEKKGNEVSFLKPIFFVLALLIPSFAFAEEPLQTVSLENIQLLRISPSDERAVVKAPDGKLKVIKVGDAIGDKGGRIIEIAEGRVVIEEKSDRETEKVIIRLEGGKQRIERIRKQGESSPPVLERRK